MKTDVDTCLKDIADFYVKNRRSMTEAELEPILKKHCESETEVKKFVSFLETEPGQLRFKTLLRERKPSTLTERKVTPVTPEVTPSVRLGQIAERTKQLNAELTSTKRGRPSQAIIARQAKIQEELNKLFVEGDQITKQLLSKTEAERKEFEKPSYLKEEARVPLSFKVVKKEEVWAPYHFLVKGMDIKPHEHRVVHAYDPADAGYIEYVFSPKYAVGEIDMVVAYKRGAGGQLVGYAESDMAKHGVKTVGIVASGAMEMGGVKGFWEKMSYSPHPTAPPAWDFMIKTITPSYLKEELTETECQLISPKYYDILTWLNVPVPDYSFAIEPEVKERKIDEVLEKLKEGVSRIHESATFREFLVTMSKFWDYSFGNQILIMLQRPGATRVAGFVTWKELGRYVKAGERGIAILAPCLPPKELRCPICGQGFTERELRTHLSAVHRREDVSILVREAREEAVAVPTPTYFKVVYVFDVSQTEGKPLPEIVVPVLTGLFNRDLFYKLMQLAEKQSVTVSFEPRPELDPAIKGTLLGKSIWIKPDEPEAQRLKTLGHELAHYYTEHVYFIPRADAEVIAESVAFTVCAHFGFDTGTRSFPYVALWAKEKKVLEQNLATIRKISGRMIEELG